MKKQEFYDANTEYYMVSVFDNDRVKHIRCPFRTKKEVNEWCEAVSTNGLYANFQVFNEKTLDLVAKYITNDEGEEIGITIRQGIFGYRYQRYAERFQAGEAPRIVST